MRAHLSKQVSEFLPVFKIFADDGSHSPVALDRPVCVVGRHEGTNLPLPAAHVSKVHALIVREQGRVYLRDLASTNGVELNGALVQETGLADTDTLRIGSYTLRCASGFGAPEENAQDPKYMPMDVPPPPAAELLTDHAKFPFPQDRHTLLIGRREGCDVRFDDPSVAPVHAILFEIDGRRYVQDFSPPGGTTLNGQPFHRIELNPGDELKVGEVSLRYALTNHEQVEAEPEVEVEAEVEAEFEAPIETATPSELMDVEDSFAPAPDSEVIDVEISVAPSIAAEAMKTEIEDPSADSAIELAVEDPKGDAAPETIAEELPASEPAIVPALDDEAIDEKEEADPNDESDIPPLFFEPIEIAPAATDPSDPEAETADDGLISLAPEEPIPAAVEITEDVGALMAMPEEITVSSLPIDAEHEGPADDEAIESPDFSEVSAGKPTEEEISTLVDEVAEKAQILKEAWIDFQSDEGKEP